MKILILTEKYLDETNPISQCVKSLIDGFISLAIKVDVVCLGEDDLFVKNNNVTVYTVKYLQYNKSLVFRYLKKILHWPIEPNIDIKKIRQTVTSLLKNNKYDSVISVHCTFISVLIGMSIDSIKSKILYILDPIGSKIDLYYKGLKKIMFPIIQFKELIAYYKFDNIIMMKCHYEKYKNYFFGLFKNKIMFNDFPLLNVRNIQYNNCHSSLNISENYCKFIIFGTLLKNTRSPKYCINLFNKLYNFEYINFELCTYIHGDGKELFYSSNICFKLYNFGIIDNEELQKQICMYDYIINIGNKITDMLPSKIFQMFMTGKPIIHFAKSKEDCCNEYMERYGNALIIYEDDDLDYSLNRLLEFLKDYKIVPIEKVKEIFKENTPEYQANLIKELVLDN